MSRLGDRRGTGYRACTGCGPPQNPGIALTWVPEGKRSRVRPRETWRRTVEGERLDMGFATWNEAVTVVKDRPDWKRQVNGPMGTETLPLQNPPLKYGLHRNILGTIRQIHIYIFLRR